MVKLFYIRLKTSISYDYYQLSLKEDDVRVLQYNIDKERYISHLICECMNIHKLINNTLFSDHLIGIIRISNDFKENKSDIIHEKTSVIDLAREAMYIGIYGPHILNISDYITKQWSFMSNTHINSDLEVIQNFYKTFTKNSILERDRKIFMIQYNLQKDKYNLPDLDIRWARSFTHFLSSQIPDKDYIAQLKNFNISSNKINIDQLYKILNYLTTVYDYKLYGIALLCVVDACDRYKHNLHIQGLCQTLLIIIAIYEKLSRIILKHKPILRNTIFQISDITKHLLKIKEYANVPQSWLCSNCALNKSVVTPFTIDSNPSNFTYSQGVYLLGCDPKTIPPVYSEWYNLNISKRSAYIKYENYPRLVYNEKDDKWRKIHDWQRAFRIRYNLSKKIFLGVCNIPLSPGYSQALDEISYFYEPPSYIVDVLNNMINLAHTPVLPLSTIRNKLTTKEYMEVLWSFYSKNFGFYSTVPPSFEYSWPNNKINIGLGDGVTLLDNQKKYKSDDVKRFFEMFGISRNEIGSIITGCVSII